MCLGMLRNLRWVKTIFIRDKERGRWTYVLMRENAKEARKEKKEKETKYEEEDRIVYSYLC